MLSLLLAAAGVMALQLHPEFSNLLAVGCYDGSIAVYDLRSSAGRLLCSTSPKTRQHADPVWQVVWQV